MVDRRSLEPARPARDPRRRAIKAEPRPRSSSLRAASAATPRSLAELRDLRLDALGRLSEHGLAPAATGTWPTAVPRSRRSRREEGYLRFIEFAGLGPTAVLLRPACPRRGREPRGVPDGARARPPWLPLVLAVSANSPWHAGRETGSPRPVLKFWRFFPERCTAGLRVVRGLGALRRAASRPRARGYVPPDLVGRAPHPGFGTPRCGCPTSRGSVEATAAFAALDPGSSRRRAGVAGRPRRVCREPLGRVPLRARCSAHPSGREAARAGAGASRRAPRAGRSEAEELGSAELLAPLRALDQADEQLEVGRRDGLGALCRRLVDLT